jgi:hypothetical protein
MKHWKNKYIYKGYTYKINFPMGARECCIEIMINYLHVKFLVSTDVTTHVKG